jgi:hypothetical protein
MESKAFPKHSSFLVDTRSPYDPFAGRPSAST